MTDPLVELNAALLRLTGQEPEAPAKPAWQVPTETKRVRQSLIDVGAMERSDLRGAAWRWVEGGKWIAGMASGGKYMLSRDGFETREKAMEYVDAYLAAEDAKKKEQKK